MQAICVTELRSISLTVIKRTIISFMPAVLVTAGIALLSLWENTQLPPSIAADDKIAHGLMYMCLAVAWLVPIQVHLRKRKLLLLTYCAVWACVTAYGVLMEMLQRFCTLTRTGEMADVYADAVGALAGLVICLILVLIRRFLTKQQNTTHSR